jgi:hypothetical protein
MLHLLWWNEMEKASVITPQLRPKSAAVFFFCLGVAVQKTYHSQKGRTRSSIQASSETLLQSGRTIDFLSITANWYSVPLTRLKHTTFVRSEINAVFTNAPAHRLQ